MSVDTLLILATGTALAVLVAAVVVSRGGTARALVGVTLLVYLVQQSQAALPMDARAIGLMSIGALLLWSAGSASRRPHISGSTGAALGFILLSVVWSSGDSQSVIVQAAFFLGLVALVAAPLPEDDLRWAVVLLLILMVVLTVGVILLSPSSLWLAGRLRGPMLNPNALALVSVLLYPVVLRWRLWLALPGTLVAFAIIWETGSRAALLAFAAQVVLAVIGSLKLFGRVVALSALALLGLYLVPKILGAAATAGAGSDTVLRSNNSRNAVWAESLARVEEAPWIGGGLGSLTSDFETGSSVFSVLIIAGLVGLVLVTLALWRAGLRAIRSVPVNDWRLLLVVGGSINALFEGWLVAAGTVYALLFWLSLESLVREPARRPAARTVAPRQRATGHRPARPLRPTVRGSA